MKISNRTKKKIKIIEDYLKKVEPSGFAHGWQIRQIERGLKYAKRGQYTEEEINDSVRTIKSLKKSERLLG